MHVSMCVRVHVCVWFMMPSIKSFGLITTVDLSLWVNRIRGSESLYVYKDYWCLSQHLLSKVSS